ncbi:MAG: hypothetical protein GY830_01870 [Bacteroidetes bacterium]|nr:hypothetical protein [Bacteroidota bacterium]
MGDSLSTVNLGTESCTSTPTLAPSFNPTTSNPSVNPTTTNPSVNPTTSYPTTSNPSVNPITSYPISLSPKTSSSELYTSSNSIPYVHPTAFESNIGASPIIDSKNDSLIYILALGISGFLILLLCILLHCLLKNKNRNKKKFKKKDIEIVQISPKIELPKNNNKDIIYNYDIYDKNIVNGQLEKNNSKYKRNDEELIRNINHNYKRVISGEGLIDEIVTSGDMTQVNNNEIIIDDTTQVNNDEIIIGDDETKGNIDEIVIGDDETKGNDDEIIKEIDLLHTNGYDDNIISGKTIGDKEGFHIEVNEEYDDIIQKDIMHDIEENITIC